MAWFHPSVPNPHAGKRMHFGFGFLSFDMRGRWRRYIAGWNVDDEVPCKGVAADVADQGDVVVVVDVVVRLR